MDYGHLVFSIPISGHCFTYNNDYSMPKSPSHLPISLFFQLRSPGQKGLRTPVKNFLRQKVISEHPDTCQESGMTWCEMSFTQKKLCFNFALLTSLRDTLSLCCRHLDFDGVHTLRFLSWYMEESSL
jgi:hypothetical protein